MKLVGTAILASLAIILWLAGCIPSLNLIFLPAFIAGLYVISEASPPNKIVTIGMWLATVSTGFFIAIYRPNDFSYPLVWHAASLYNGGEPFLLHANGSKAVGGYLIIMFLLPFTTPGPKQAPLPESITLTTIVVISMIFIASFIFEVGWQPKLSEGILIFSIVNLGVTVIAEEAFFRLLIQDYISSFFENKFFGVIVPVSITALLFAVAHTNTFGPELLLHLAAGLGYCLVYTYTKRLSMAIASHFGVNILHFLLLEYPLPPL